jgi:hypothetical protein
VGRTKTATSRLFMLPPPPRPHPHARSTHPGRVAPVVLVQTRRHSLTVTKDAVWFMVRFLVIQLIYIDLNLKFNICVVFKTNYFSVEDDQ